MNQRKLNLWSPLRSVQAEVPWTSWGLRSASVGPGRGPPDLVDPLRPNGVFVSTRGYKLEQCGDKKTPSHMCEGVFLVVATRFELATSASRTQRSTKLSHATIINMNCVNIKIINKNPLIVKQKTNMIEEKVAKTIKP